MHGKINIGFNVIPEKNLLIEYYGGSITMDDIINLKKKTIQHPDFHVHLNYIADFRDAVLNLNKQDLLRYIEFVKKNKSVYSIGTAAFLTYTPEQVAYATLFKVLGKELPINLGIYSTIEAAMNWIGLSSKDFDMVDKSLTNLHIGET